MSWHRANIRNRRCGHEGGSTGTSRSGDDPMGTARPLLAALAIEKTTEKSLAGRNSEGRSSSVIVFSPPWRAKGIGNALCSPHDSRRGTLSESEKALAHAALTWEKTSRKKKLRRSGRFRPETEGVAKPAADKVADHTCHLAPESAEQAGGEEYHALDRPGATCHSPCTPRPGLLARRHGEDKGDEAGSHDTGIMIIVAAAGSARNASGSARARRGKNACDDPILGDGRNLGKSSTSIAYATCGKRKANAQLRRLFFFRSTHPARPACPMLPTCLARQDPPGARRKTLGLSGGSPGRKEFQHRSVDATCEAPTLEAWHSVLRRIPPKKRHDAWKATWEEASPLGPHVQAAAQKGQRRRRRKTGTPALIRNIAFP